VRSDFALPYCLSSWHCSKEPKGRGVMAKSLRSAQQVSSSSQACTSCKSLGQPGFYSLIWAHKVRFPGGGVSLNPKKILGIVQRNAKRHSKRESVLL